MLDKDQVDRVTLAQVATEAGVSLSTVSKVLNGRTDVSATTRARVEDVIARNGYRPRRARLGTGPGLLLSLIHI